MCNDPYTVEVQENEEAEPDDEVVQGGKECAAGTRTLFSAYRATRGRGAGLLQGARPQAKRLEPNAILQMSF